jgi:hypothetical protein
VAAGTSGASERVSILRHPVPLNEIAEKSTAMEILPGPLEERALFVIEIACIERDILRE